MRRHGFELDESVGAGRRVPDGGPESFTLPTLLDVIENFYDEGVASVVRRANALRGDIGMRLLGVQSTDGGPRYSVKR